MQSRSPLTKLLLNSRESSEALGVSQRTLWSLTQSGEIPCVRIGRCVRYAADDLRDFIESQKKRQESAR